MSSHTVVPKTLLGQQRKAEGFLDLFSKLTAYKHRKHNPYLKWLLSGPKLESDAMYLFFNFWYPVSKHQPQILLRIAAAFPNWHDRRLIMNNYLEEDGMVKVGDDPHYNLLEQLIIKLGGKLDVDAKAEELVNRFHMSLVSMTTAQAIGYLAAIEHPALDISDYFQQLTRLAGREDLLATDPYLYIHVDVEPKHIIWSHGNALTWMEDEQMQSTEGYSRGEVVEAFQNAMSFWDNFWKLAFQKLGFK